MAATRKRKTDDFDAERSEVHSGSDLADRHRRTSKHRVPHQTGKPHSRKRKPAKAAAPEQKKLPFGKSMSLSRFIGKDPFTKRLVRAGGIIVAGLLAIAGLIIVYQLVAGTRFFAVRSIELEGNSLLSRTQIENIVRPVIKGGVLKVDLNQIRDELRKNELVSEVQVTRVLPDILRVKIKEREPYALARMSDGSVVCVDRNGSTFGDQSLFRNRLYLPMITGLSEEGERAAEINRQRLLTYQKLVKDLDGTQPPLSSKIDEVIFEDVQGIRVILSDSHIAVFLGKEDFRTRLNAALDVLDAIKRKDAEALNVLRIGDAEKLLSGVKIAYLNATIPKRVIVGLDE